LPLFHNNIIKDDAIFIADSHYNKKRVSLEILLNKIISNEIKTSQVFLMGDMFDFLCEDISYFKKINQNIINLINELSNQVDIIYFEGNHDFNIKNIFFNIKVISRDEQYSVFEYNNKKVYLSHGDIFTPLSYNIFTTILRNKYFLKCLNIIDINSFISKYFENKLINKSICHDFESFEQFAKKRIKLYNTKKDELIIEGHFHQGNIYENYINIPSLACKNRYMQIQNNRFTIKELEC
jgi:UDP-2,3-diacylglucosamine hydrolase